LEFNPCSLETARPFRTYSLKQRSQRVLISPVSTPSLFWSSLMPLALLVSTWPLSLTSYIWLLSNPSSLSCCKNALFRSQPKYCFHCSHWLSQSPLTDNYHSSIGSLTVRFWFGPAYIRLDLLCAVCFLLKMEAYVAQKC
jgi:hypothetical protein